MVTDSFRDRRRDDGSDDDRRDRGQVILIGAITLAFIVLGVVVVFNGVLYTETLSSADTGQTASGADATELEIRQGVACLVAEREGEDLEDDDGTVDNLTEILGEHEEQLVDDIEEYSRIYQNATAHSQPASVNIDTDESDVNFDNDSGSLSLEEAISVTITYDSSDLSYERTLEIDSEECPENDAH